jgi:hypothetical protein
MMSLLYGSWIWFKSLFKGDGFISKQEEYVKSSLDTLHKKVHIATQSINKVEIDCAELKSSFNSLKSSVHHTYTGMSAIGESSKRTESALWTLRSELSPAFIKSDPVILEALTTLKISIDRITLDYECILKRHIQQTNSLVKDPSTKKPVKNPRKIRPKKAPVYVFDTHS